MPLSKNTSVSSRNDSDSSCSPDNSRYFLRRRTLHCYEMNTPTMNKKSKKIRQQSQTTGQIKKRGRPRKINLEPEELIIEKDQLNDDKVKKDQSSQNEITKEQESIKQIDKTIPEKESNEKNNSKVDHETLSQDVVKDESSIRMMKIFEQNVSKPSCSELPKNETPKKITKYSTNQLFCNEPEPKQIKKSMADNSKQPLVEFQKIPKEVVNPKKTNNVNQIVSKTELNALLEDYMNREDILNLNYQHQCIKNLIQFLTNDLDLHSQYIYRYLIKQIKRNIGFLPSPKNPSLVSICRFNSKSEPQFDFFFHETSTFFSPLEMLKNVDNEMLRGSKVIYALIYHFYEQHREQFQNI